MVPRRLRRWGARTRSRRSELFQLREFHAQFSDRAKVEGEARLTYLSDLDAVVEASLPLATIAEAFDGSNPPPEVLVLGDSSDLFVSRFDLSRRPLLRMTVQRLAPRRTCVLAHFGWHFGVLKALLQAVASMPTQPCVVVLPMNLRQFSPQWAENPNFQFRELMAAASAFAADPTAGVPLVPPFPRGDLTRGGAADPREWERFRAVRVACKWRSEDTIGEYLDMIATSPADAAARHERLRDVFAFHWLPGDNVERLAWLAEAVQVADGFGARIVGHMSPINYEAGRRFVGPSFDDLIAGRVDAARRVCEDSVGDSGHLTVDDLTHLLPSDRFFYPADPTEHYDEIGRARVANRIAASVRRAIEPARGARRIESATPEGPRC